MGSAGGAVKQCWQHFRPQQGGPPVQQYQRRGVDVLPDSGQLRLVQRCQQGIKICSTVGAAWQR